MNKDAVLHILQNLFSGIDVHEELTPELLELISRTGAEDQYFKTIIFQLAILMQVGVLATNRPDFELVKDGIYSMKQKSSEYNIRILYSFLPNRKPILLCAFYERGGKSKTDYSPYLPVAKARLAQHKEEM